MLSDKSSSTVKKIGVHEEMIVPTMLHGAETWMWEMEGLNGGD